MAYELFNPEGLIPDTCAVPGCPSAIKSRGYCVAHYDRFLKYSDPLAGSAHGEIGGAVMRFRRQAMSEMSREVREAYGF